MANLWRRFSAIVLIVIVLNIPMEAGATDGCNQSSAELTLRVICKSDGELPEDGSLTFVLWDEQFNILQKVVNLRGNASFAPLNFLAKGKYIYYISQEGGGSIEVTYDPVVYQIVVTVTEDSGCLTARVTEVNQVSGDPMGEVRILSTFESDWIPVFENRTRQISVPPLAEVPKTDGGIGLWPVTGLVFSVGLLLVCIRRKNT